MYGIVFVQYFSMIISIHFSYRYNLYRYFLVEISTVSTVILLNCRLTAFNLDVLLPFDNAISISVYRYIRIDSMSCFTTT